LLATGELTVVWRKSLAASDVQRQPGHATGGVRLTQARFRDASGDNIDHTTYFRELFKGFDWQETRAVPHVEEAEVDFLLVVEGESLGVHALAVSHKPSGEAGQRNYTTSLKWGRLAGQIHRMDLRGKTLTLYAPPPGKSEPYVIDIR